MRAKDQKQKYNLEANGVWKKLLIREMFRMEKPKLTKLTEEDDVKACLTTIE